MRLLLGKKATFNNPQNTKEKLQGTIVHTSITWECASVDHGAVGHYAVAFVQDSDGKLHELPVCCLTIVEESHDT